MKQNGRKVEKQQKQKMKKKRERRERERERDTHTHIRCMLFVIWQNPGTLKSNTLLYFLYK